MKSLITEALENTLRGDRPSPGVGALCSAVRMRGSTRDVDQRIAALRARSEGWE